MKWDHLVDSKRNLPHTMEELSTILRRETGEDTWAADYTSNPDGFLILTYSSNTKNLAAVLSRAGYTIKPAPRRMARRYVTDAIVYLAVPDAKKNKWESLITE